MRSSDEAISALAAYLRTEIPALTVYEEWPDPKKPLKMPTLAITAPQERGYSHVQPTIFKKSPNVDNPDLFNVVYTIGQFDYRIQLDLWADYKAKRGEFFDLIQAALNKQFINEEQPCGLSLTLTKYHDLIARFDQVGYTYLDGEESSQRQEWRVRIAVNVSHSRLQEKVKSKMKEIQIHHEISDDLDVESGDQTLEEITEI